MGWKLRFHLRLPAEKLVSTSLGVGLGPIATSSSSLGLSNFRAGCAEGKEAEFGSTEINSKKAKFKKKLRTF